MQHVVMAAIQHLLTSCMPSTPVGTSSKEVEELQDEVCCSLKNKTFVYTFKSQTYSHTIHVMEINLCN